MEEKDKNNASDITEESELQKLERERDEYLEGWKRAKADFINYKHDESRRVEEMIAFSNKALIYELITVLDSFHIAITSHNNAKETKGLSIILGQLEESLKRFGLEKITVTPGVPFDPNTQEAIQEVVSDKPAGTVDEEVSRGYALHNKVIRPARVQVSKGQAS